MTNIRYKYERALISFVDILGFKHLIDTSTVEYIRNVLLGKDTLMLERWHLKDTKGGDPKFVKADNTTSFSFSDLIVNVTPLDATYPLHLIFEEIRALGFRQFRLATEGIFVRGGITVGDIYVEGRTIFGPALIKAYEIESKTAKWPIIAIDPDMIRDLQTQVPEYLQRRQAREGSEGEIFGKFFLSNLSKIVHKTEDGTFFLDYISCLAYEDQTTGDLHYYLEDHKNSLDEAYRRYGHWKYKFVAQYHNVKCQHYYPENSALLVKLID